MKGSLLLVVAVALMSMIGSSFGDSDSVNPDPGTKTKCNTCADLDKCKNIKDTPMDCAGDFSCETVFDQMGMATKAGCHTAKVDPKLCTKVEECTAHCNNAEPTKPCNMESKIGGGSGGGSDSTGAPSSGEGGEADGGSVVLMVSPMMILVASLLPLKYFKSM